MFTGFILPCDPNLLPSPSPHIPEKNSQELLINSVNVVRVFITTVASVRAPLTYSSLPGAMKQKLYSNRKPSNKVGSTSINFLIKKVLRQSSSIPDLGCCIDIRSLHSRSWAPISKPPAQPFLSFSFLICSTIYQS